MPCEQPRDIRAVYDWCDHACVQRSSRRPNRCAILALFQQLKGRAATAEEIEAMRIQRPQHARCEECRRHADRNPDRRYLMRGFPTGAMPYSLIGVCLPFAGNAYPSVRHAHPRSRGSWKPLSSALKRSRNSLSVFHTQPLSHVSDTPSLVRTKEGGSSAGLSLPRKMMQGQAPVNPLGRCGGSPGDSPPEGAERPLGCGQRLQ